MIGVTSDFHLKDDLAYADYVKDRRIPEKKEILDFIIKEFKDCHTIVLCGDQFNKRNNPSEIVKEFVEFIERFGDKNMIILAGNHEKFGTGKSAIDFLKEIKGKDNWTICTKEILNIDMGLITKIRITLVPYTTNTELGVKDNKEGAKKIMKRLDGGDIIFVHHAISNISLGPGQSTNLFNEIVLPKNELEKRYKLVVGSHIHKPQEDKNTIIIGSVFNNEVGETQKYIWKIDEKTLKVEKIALPGRGVYGLENPTIKDLDKIGKHNIVKATFTDSKYKNNLDELKQELRKFDAHILLEQYPHERKKLHFEEGMLEFSVEQLLDLYAKTKKVDSNKLKRAWELVK